MIKRVTVENFKSIEYLEIDCKRVNVFIGEPNSGKSNILEAIVGLPSAIGFERTLSKIIRFENLSNIFYDELTDRSIIIKLDSLLKLK